MRSILAMAALSASLFAGAANPELKIFTDDEHTDTVFKQKYYVIAVTQPDAKGYIDGKEVHVYKTGSFGAEIALKPGLNKIPVEAKVGKKKSKTEAIIYYNDQPSAAKQSSGISEKKVDAPFNVISKPYAYLQYGNGGDRLGGAKVGYIHEGIPLKVVAEAGRLYKVRLSENRYAYIQKEDVEALNDGEPCSSDFTGVNSSSWSISNAGKNDRVVISLPAKLPFASWTEIEPSVIKVEIFGAMNNSNWITQRGETEMIDFVDYDHSADNDVLTVVLRLKDKYQWGYDVRYEGTNLVIDVRHKPASLDLKDLVIGLDAGHGGEYPGAISPSGLTEKEVNLDIVLNAAEILRNLGAKVVLTRDGDTGPSMTERKKIWKEGNVDLAVSVHNNASGNPLTTMGTSCYYKHISNRPLAQAVHKSMLSLGVENFGLTGNFNFSLNGPTEYPNTLVEGLFMSSLPEEELLASPEYRRQMAQKVVDGIIDYLEIVKKADY